MRVIQTLNCAALGLMLIVGGIGAARADRPKTGGTYSEKGSSRTGTGGGSSVAADPKLTTPPQCITPTQDAAGEGRRAFMRMNCYSCHGMGGHGGAMGPSLVGEADETAEAVTQGEGEGMPSFKNNLCPNDLANLTAYLRLLGTGSEPTFVNWWESHPSR